MFGVQHLPFPILAAIAFICGSYLLLRVYRVESFNKIAGIAFVIWFYSLFLNMLLITFDVPKQIIWPLLKWSNIISAIILVYGVYISYTKGTHEQRVRWKEASKGLVVIGVLLSLLFLIGLIF